MKRVFTITLLLLGFMSFVFHIAKAQVVYSEDFESLNVGEGISLQVPANWTTWNDSPGTGEDPLVSDAFANGGTKSLVVDATINDVVMTVGDLTENRYKMEFYLYIPSNRCAFYSPMQEFDAAQSIYTNGCQVFFNNGEGTIDASGVEDVTEFTFNHDEWLHIENYFDLDNDIIELYINDELIHIGAWSPGPSSTSSAHNTLQGFDIYGWDGGTPEFYLDDIVFQQVAVVDPAQNLSLAIQNQFNIELTWEAPVSGTPDSYLVYRDNELIATIADALTYLDEHLYPETYEYFVMAYYGETIGNSVPSNTESIEIEGGVQRQFALLEIFTGTECDDAKWLVYSTNLLESAGLNYIQLNYVQDAGFSVDGISDIVDIYTPVFDEDEDESLLCPSSIVNGKWGMEGYIGNMADQKNYYADNITEALSVSTLYTISNISTDLLDVTVDVEELVPFFDDEISIKAIVVENEVEYSWQGQSELNYLVRQIQSQTLDFSGNSVQTKSFTLSLDNVFSVSNCYLVFYVQNMGSLEIMEGTFIPLDYLVGIDNVEKQLSSAVYPNPAEDIVSVKASEDIESLEIINITGQVVDNIQVNSVQKTVDLSKYEAGVYFVKVYMENNVDLHKLIVR